MTRLFNDPAVFAEEMLAGFLEAYADYVVPVPGGVVRANAPREGKVAVVIGGGSGHYPAFCGTVGPGFADGAVVGHVFTSPSTAEAASVGRAANAGGGVFLTTGNYAGDVLNFSLAAEQLNTEGIPAKYFAVTDDIASASIEEKHKRRGVAGDVVVFKVASAAAEEGYDLDGVAAVAAKANELTRSLGVAFGSCTLPGAEEPLFSMPAGVMGLGMGIHGEPGVSEEEMPTANELADLFVTRLLAEKPEGASNRIAVILNGLGTTKYEELFVVWGKVASLLREAGYELVRPEVGELVTSLDMAGCSLTIAWLDEELERLWLAPADTPAFRRGAVADQGERRVVDAAAVAGAAAAVVEADEDSQRCAASLGQVFDAINDRMVAAEEELGRIDAVAGDGDHGRGMVNGSTAARAAVTQAIAAGAGHGGVLRAAGEQWGARAGGTSGVLWGAALTALGTQLGDQGSPDGPAVASAMRGTYDALVRLGGAKPGDKTMLDALLPFVEAFEAQTAAGEDWREAWQSAAAVAEQAAQDTANLRPKIGRARPLAERSLGTPDAGAISMAMCLRSAGEVLIKQKGATA